MKKIITICAIITTILIGCSKEDLNPPADPHQQYYLDSLQHIVDSLSKLTPCGSVIKCQSVLWSSGSSSYTTYDISVRNNNSAVVKVFQSNGFYNIGDRYCDPYNMNW